tara:strand:- start:4163 stop:5149 length:987 start_codon:yes stop_codon:yes gene_type:complete
MDSTLKELAEEVATLRKVATVIETNMNCIATIREKIGRVSNQTILSLEKHRSLMMKFLRSDCKKYTNVETAIKNVTKAEILINCTELDLYGVFSLKDYVHFVDGVRNESYAYDVDYNPTQVVLASWQQKIVFLCSPSKGDIIKKHASIYFRSDIDIIEKNNMTEITVLNKLVPNLEESNICFYDFMNFMHNQLTKVEIAELDIKLPYISYSNSIEKEKYFTCNLKNHIELKDIQELANVLKSGGFLQVNGNNNNVHHNNINITINVNTITPNEWIRANPPGDREEKTVYHQRYVESGGTASHVSFCREVTKNGYKSCHSGSSRYYKKI